MYRLIHIAQDPGAHHEVAVALEQGAYPFAVEKAALQDRAAPVDDPEGVDAVILGGNAGERLLDDLRRCRGTFPGRPIIVLTETPDMCFAQDVLRAGAQDVVLKQERSLAVLARILLYAIERANGERRQEELRREARFLSALLDTLVGNPFDSILQTDAEGGIERASPAALGLLGLDAPAGRHLEERIRRDDRPRFRGFFDLAGTAARPLPMTFPFIVDGETRLLEVEPVPLRTNLPEAPRLFRLSELVADFSPAADSRPASALGEAVPALEQQAQATTRPAALSTAKSDTAAPAGAAKVLAMIDRIAGSAAWRCVPTQGAPGHRFGFLANDAKSNEALANLARRADDDADVTLALDRLQVDAWRDLAASGAAGTRYPLLFEVSYATLTSHGHFERLQNELDEHAGELRPRLHYLLRHVPDGIHVPTLAKVSRALAAERPRPGISLTDLAQDYRLLPFDHLSILSLGLADLRQAVAADAKRLTGFFRRVRSEGALVVVRGVAGPLAEKLRQRLGVDLTVEA